MQPETLEAEPKVEWEQPQTPLTGHDRCDRCRAQAYYRITLYSGLDLLFCVHHYKKHEVGLEHFTFRLQDESSHLVDNASPAMVD